MRVGSVCLLFLFVGVSGCLSAQLTIDDANDDDAGPPAPPLRPERHMAAHAEAIHRFGATVSHPTETGNGGQGIWIHRSLLYWTQGVGLEIYDLRGDQPNFLGAAADIGARDVDVLEWQGRLYAALAGSSRGMHLVDVTDPTAPWLVTTVELPSAGVHNLASVPGTPYIYSSGSSPSRQIDVLDITIPTKPVVHTFPIPDEMDGVALNSNGCHDISVRSDLGRAYCAGGGGQYHTGGGETFIWDITPEAGGPTDPTWVSFMDDPRVVYNHQAIVNDAGTILIVNDEHIGPNCLSVDLSGVTSEQDPKVPFGAAWIWDISIEKEPRLMGVVQNDAITRFVTDARPELAPQLVNCGSHFGDIVPGTDKFVMGWYGGGTILVDYLAPEEPVVLDYAEADGSTWDAQYWDGRVWQASGTLLETRLV